MDLRPNLVSFWGRTTRREEKRRREEEEEKKRREEERKSKKVWILVRFGMELYGSLDFCMESNLEYGTMTISMDTCFGL